MRANRCLRALVCTAAVMLTAATALAQQRTATTRPGWLPRSVQIEGGITPAQQAEAVARLEQIERILLQVPEIANPRGFEIEPVFYGGARRLGPGQTARSDYVVEYMLTLIFYVPTRAIAHEGCGCLRIRVNPLGNPGERAIRDDKGREVWVEASRGEPIPGATQVLGKLSPTEVGHVYVLLTPGQAVPWRQVRREEYYNAWITEIEGPDGSRVAANQARLQQTRYQEWLEGAAQRKKEREDLYRSLAAAQSAAEVDKLRKTLEDTERDVGERLQATEADDRENNAAGLAATTQQTTALRNELAAMSADERRMPALLDPDVSGGGRVATGWRMADRDGPGLLRALTHDYDYWRARRSPVEPLGIQAYISVSGSGVHPPVHRALWQSFTMMDWAALYRLLDPPR